MSANVLTINKTNNVRVRGIALPVEHGAWGFLFEPLVAAIAISSSVAVIALAGGWTFPAATAWWGIFVARLIHSILYVRNRLKLEKGKEFQMYPVFAAHFLAFGLVGMLAANGLASKLTLVIFVLLLVRSITGLSPFRSKMKAVKIGIWEVIYGLLTVLSVIIGYYIQF